MSNSVNDAAGRSRRSAPRGRRGKKKRSGASIFAPAETGDSRMMLHLGSALTTLAIGKPLLPAVRVQRHRFVSRATLSPAAGVCAVQVYRTSLFDPDLTGAGSQPTLFDDLALMYSTYYVRAARLTATFAKRTSTDALVCGIQKRYNATTETDAREYIAGQKVVWSLSPASDTQPIVGIMDFRDAADFGINGRVDETQQAAPTASPVKLYYWHIFCAAADGSADPGSIDVWTEIEFEAVWLRPIAQNLD